MGSTLVWNLFPPSPPMNCQVIIYLCTTLADQLLRISLCRWDLSLESIFLHGAIKESLGLRVSSQFSVCGVFAIFLKHSRFYTGPMNNALNDNGVGPPRACLHINLLSKRFQQSDPRKQCRWGHSGPCTGRVLCVLLKGALLLCSSSRPPIGPPRQPAGRRLSDMWCLCRVHPYPSLH